MVKAPSEIAIFDNRICICVQSQGETDSDVCQVKLADGFSYIPQRIKGKMRNITFGSDFFLYNDAVDQIKS